MGGILDRLDAYLDLAPRTSARTEEVGPFTLFVGTGAWRYYARPARSRARSITATDIAAVGARQDELAQPQVLEWVWELVPELPDAARAAGLTVRRSPLLALELSGCDGEVGAGVAPAGMRARTVTEDDPVLPRAMAAIELGFRAGGEAAARGGPRERDALLGDVDAQLGFVRQRLRDGAQIMVVAESDEGAGPIAGGSVIPREEVAELVGIATIPAWRRRGAGSLVTAALVRAAAAAGVELAMLSAADEGAARVYERVGFRRVGSVGEARPPSP